MIVSGPGVVVSASVNEAKTKFFGPRLIEVMGRARYDALYTTSMYVKNSMQWSLKYAKGRSTPGSPPNVHRPGTFRMVVNKKGKSVKKWSSSPLKQHIYAIYDRATDSAVVGPTLLAGVTRKVPGVLEFGGQAKNPDRRIRKVGSGGEIVVSGARINGKSAHEVVAMVGGVEKTMWVRYARLRTQKQVDRANRFNEMLYGPMVLNVRPRPYSRPALEKNADQIAKQYAKAFKREASRAPTG